MKKLFALLFMLLSFMFLNCAQKNGEFVRDNPLDAEGVNWKIISNLEMIYPKDEQTATFSTFDYYKRKGSVNLSYIAEDNDGKTGHAVYTVYLGESKTDMSMLYNGESTSFTVENLDTIKTYYWQLVAKTLNGSDSIVQTGTFITPPTHPTGMVLISAAGNSFQMGSENGESDEQPVHTVSFTYNFFMDTTEVTQKDYETLLGVNPSNWQGDNLPVEQCNWYDAVLYCNARSKRDGRDTVYSYSSILGTPGNGCTLSGLVIDLSKKGYRLPTEAEWEYVCRAGTTTDYYWGGGTIGDYAWYDSNSGGKTHDVATKLPNSYKLYDMSGNVWEWCNDWYGADYYSSSPGTDPTGPASGSDRVDRGGSWFIMESHLRSAIRARDGPVNGSYDYGFRCVLSSGI